MKNSEKPVLLNAVEFKNPIFFEAVELMTLLSNAASMEVLGNWTLAMKNKKIDSLIDSIKFSHGEDFWKKVFALSDVEKFALGFRKFIVEGALSPNDGKMNIPVWIWNLLPFNMELSAGRRGELSSMSKSGCVYWRE